MVFTLNLKQGIDLPIYQWLRFLPATNAAGCCMCADERGTNRYVYILFSTTSFWRYDIWTDSFQQLASPGALGGSGTWGAGSCMVFDPSQGTSGRVWLFNGYTTQCGFGYFDVATNAWTSRSIANLTAVWGTDGAMAHTCSTYNVAGNDDYIYLIGNAATPFFRFSIAGNSWSVMANPITASAGAGCSLHWAFGYNADRLYAFRGLATVTVYYFTVSTGVWATLTYYPNTETFSTGSSAAYDGLNRIYVVKDATHRMYYLQLDTNLMEVAGMFPYSSGTAVAGDGLVYVKTSDGAQYLYYRRLSGTEFWRTLIGWF
jgi:hypothetical protein